MTARLPVPVGLRPPDNYRDTQTLSIKIQWSDNQTELHVFPSDSRPLLTLAADMARTLTAWEVVLSSLEFGVHVRKTLGTTFKVRFSRLAASPAPGTSAASGARPRGWQRNS